VDSEALRIDFWDVGQGDCCVVTLPNGSLIAIDVGPAGSPLIDWLADHGPTTLEAVVLTHNHRDHIGALPAILKLPQISIKTIYMVQDPNPMTDDFRRIMRPVREAVTLTELKVWQLTTGQMIWAANDASASIEVRFPDFLGALDATSKNAMSGILSLDIQGKTSLLWSGDAMLRDIGTVVSATRMAPTVLAGPHHGAPQDFLPGDSETGKLIDRIGACRSFVSVGSTNGYGHPRRKYLKQLTKSGCLVSCSQIASHCQAHGSKLRRPLLQSHGLLGVRPPRGGIACRGAMRYTVINGKLTVDSLEETHRERVRTQVYSPACQLPSHNTPVEAT
jgi:competence protein ComEC